MISDVVLAEAARRLRLGVKTGIYLAGPGLRADALALAGGIAERTGAVLLASNLVARHERGAGRVPVKTIPYAVDAAVAFLADFRQLILVGAADRPVSFFAYPGLPSTPLPEACEVHRLAGPDEDIPEALQRLAEAIGAGKATRTAAFEPPPPARGTPTPQTIAQSLAALIPENAIVVDEAVSAGGGLMRATRNARPHDWLKNMGGSIGFALPAAAGAAIACPERKVICLEADGSGMYTLQALWTHAREKLDVLTVVFNNRAYAILRDELTKVQAGEPGANAANMLEIGRPDIDWTALSKSLGVEAERVVDMDGFNRCFEAGIRSHGPFLIEVMM